ncbi:hypothetical protein [Coralloluteibacterium thermophilus]|uniref:Uncharacterized protein n=1 Tax=Coralloluteibacterium thermophilum TaxID=2707049 RepID=A0ABV9NMJ2_9GAMM
MDDSMVVVDLVPHVGAGPILLGSPRVQARQALLALGFPLEWSRGSVDYFFESAIQTQCGPDDRISFIGLSCHERFTVRYQGRNVFALPAAQLFALIAASEESGAHTYEPCEYCFPDQVITLWDEDEQYDRLGNESNPVWAQVGVGSQAYVAAIGAVRGKV